ncbi:MAG TPA: hypothetical protein DEP84_36660 [Chloroflexi bacterium]|nr:hypothetical protein [Chloroflexota bacterium]
MLPFRFGPPLGSFPSPLPSCVTVDATDRIVQIQLNALDLLAMRVVTACQRPLHPYTIAVETTSLEF